MKMSVAVKTRPLKVLATLNARLKERAVARVALWRRTRRGKAIGS